jgi:membrane-bound metal-dependent hydrolase YbcI (DUF457 family)
MHLTQHLVLSHLIGVGALDARRDRIFVAIAGIAPDIDAPILLAFGKDAFIEYHHDWTHHIAGAFLVAVVAAMVAKQRGRTAVLATIAWGGHLLCDMIGAGDRHPGEPFAYTVPLLWPFSDRPFEPFAWSWPLASWQNGVVMALLLATAAWAGARTGRTPVEILSVKADQSVVEVLRRRLGQPAA